MERRREPTRFTERLSTFMVMVAAGGAAWVLADPKTVDPIWGFSIGGEGFSADLKGAVISAILIGGWTAVKEYWLGASDTGRNQGATLGRIAENAAPTTTTTAAATAAAVAAAVTTPQAHAEIKTDHAEIKTDEVTVSADTVNVGQPAKKEPETP